jgi:hypothetical protein
MPNITNEVLAEIVNEIRCDVKEIKEQTLRTNGRVGKLEIWRGIITGGLIVISAVVVPLFLESIR